MHGFTSAFAVAVGSLALAAAVVASFIRVPGNRDVDGEDRSYNREGSPPAVPATV